MRDLIGEQVTAKKKLRKMIKETKKKAWKLLAGELENDRWGKPYQIVTRRFGIKRREYLDTKE